MVAGVTFVVGGVDILSLYCANIGEESKTVVVTDVIPMLSRVTDQKLNRSNYLEWNNTIKIYLRSIFKDDHLTKDPPTDDDKTIVWLRDDAQLILQIRNSIQSEVFSIISHCEYVKSLIEYLKFLHSGKENISHIYDVCKEFY